MPSLLLFAAILASPDQGWRADTAWIASGMVADAVATEWALKNCVSCEEVNPLMRSNTAGRLLLKTGGLVGAAAVCHQLRKDGHPRQAKVFRWVVTGLFMGLAIHNVHTARKYGP